ncbi:MAG: zinc-ribbon domain-containing protein, partial [Clostridiales bacterium]|nr:zinc-ribbon domain-containing protein [Clostridiales bacterium]
MKVCPKCGVPNEDSMNFCSSCRTVLGLSQTQQDEKVQTRKGVLEAFKSVGSSKVMLAIVILFVAIMVFSIIELKNFDSYVNAQFSQSQFGNSQLERQAFKAGAVIGLVIAALPVILMFLWFFLFYASSTKATDSINTGGLSLLRGLSIFYLVIGCIM